MCQSHRIATLINLSADDRQQMDLFGKTRGGSEQKVWKCEHCNMIFDDKERMKRHKRKAHGEKAGDDMPNMNPFGFS